MIVTCKHRDLERVLNFVNVVINQECIQIQHKKNRNSNKLKKHNIELIDFLNICTYINKCIHIACIIW